MRRSPENKNLSRFAAATAAATLVLICFGGLVTSHGAGLAVPDWPNTYGYNLFYFPIESWVGGIFYEHTHRLIGSVVGLLTTLLALGLLGRSGRPWLRWGGIALVTIGFTYLLLGIAGRPNALQHASILLATSLVALVGSRYWPVGDPAPRWLRRLGLAAWLLVVVQGVLGGLRVVLLQDFLGIIHATLAQLFLLLICAVALWTSGWWSQKLNRWRVTSDPRGLRWWVLGLTVLILAQLVLGASMRHRHAGLAIPDFPLAYGKIWPDTQPEHIARYNQARDEETAVNPIRAGDIYLQMVHRFVALGIVALVVTCAVLAGRRFGRGHPLAWGTLIWAAMVLMQAVLGAATVWTGKSADIATAHVAVGSLTLACGGLLTLTSFRLLASNAVPNEDTTVESSRPLSTPLTLPRISQHAG